MVVENKSDIDPSAIKRPGRRSNAWPLPRGTAVRARSPPGFAPYGAGQADQLRDYSTDIAKLGHDLGGSKIMASDHLIAVRPVPGGWSVSTEDLESLMFLSGAKAEAKAKALAISFADCGSDARVAIFDRAGRLVATHRYFASDPITA